MMNRFLKAVTATIYVMSWFVIMSSLGAGIYLYWEDRKPVMQSVYIKAGTQAVTSENRIILDLAGVKILEVCKKTPYSDEGYVVVDGYKKEARHKYVDDETPLSTFDGGKIDMGRSEFVAEGAERAEFVGLRFKHDCRGIEKVSPIYWLEVPSR